MEATNYTSLREILAESLKEKGETFDDIETTTHQSQLGDPVPTNTVGDYDLPPDKTDFCAWTKNHVYFFRCTYYGDIDMDSVPRNPPPSA